LWPFADLNRGSGDVRSRWQSRPSTMDPPTSAFDPNATWVTEQASRSACRERLLKAELLSQFSMAVSLRCDMDFVPRLLKRAAFVDENLDYIRLIQVTAIDRPDLVETRVGMPTGARSSHDIKPKSTA